MNHIRRVCVFLAVFSTLICSCKTVSGIQCSESAIAGDVVLLVVDELRLDSCKIHQPVHFSLTVTNGGKAPLSICNIDPSCDCVKLLSKKTFLLNAGESRKIDFVFTPETTGEIFREITLFSNAINPVETIRVIAIVE